LSVRLIQNHTTIIRYFDVTKIIATQLNIRDVSIDKKYLESLKTSKGSFYQTDLKGFKMYS